MDKIDSCTSRQEIDSIIWNLRDSGNLFEAVKICNEVIKKQPHKPFYNKIAGDLYFQMGEYENSATFYLEYLKKLNQPRISLHNLLNAIIDFDECYQKNNLLIMLKTYLKI